MPGLDTNNVSSPSSSSCNDIYRCRTLAQIVWSCTSVVIACTWVSVHPNVPGPTESSWRILRRRIGLMMITLIAPELLVLWAARQWFAARRLSKVYKNDGWTMTHAFFALMGGFALYKGRTCICVLRHTSDYPDETLFIGHAKFIGETSQREIGDLCHRDVLGKLVAVSQTAWFMIQLAARSVEGLPITELEIMTLAFATMNVAIYYFWWNKPQDVGYHIRIQRETSPDRSDSSIRRDISQRTEQEPEGLWARMCKFFKSSKERVLNWSKARTNSPRVRKFRKSCLDKGVLDGTMVCIIRPPLQALMEALLENVPDNMFEEATVPLKIVLVIIYIIAAPLVILAFVIIADEEKYQVEKVSLLERTRELEPRYAADNVIMYIATVVFGVIHCLAWTFNFPSITEERLWRICALLVTFLPLFLVFYHFIYDKYLTSRPGWAKWFTLISLVVFLFYLFARICLVVQAFLALRDLPPGAFETVQLTIFIPHI
ncbi:hypothetical protein GYMLUDRAFT_178282 [Collybiopsis luxurians FD-317 M1]|uniref:Uncharacterized protein n=1 Tax=Collybiopsis luxurians FD-317 M1 TaxID=944289 RepID=A0A0D0ATZ0_9AGAR|nr:hypothetical protein GYMLUDRAFT_178282 [Collybiopsis luxurians FD-317 M1]